MSEFSVLKKISESLKDILADILEGLVEKADISFDSPGDIEASDNRPQVSLFLFQTKTNFMMRNSVEYVDKANKEITPAPTYLDLQFLITPYAGDRETEFDIFERVYDGLLRKGAIQGNELPAAIAADNPSVKIVSETLSTDELNKIWGLFPNKSYKRSASFLLSPVAIPSGKKRSYVPVSNIKSKVLYSEDLENKQESGENP